LTVREFVGVQGLIELVEVTGSVPGSGVLGFNRLPVEGAHVRFLWLERTGDLGLIPRSFLKGRDASRSWLLVSAGRLLPISWFCEVGRRFPETP